MVRRRKLLEIAAESPASGARFVRRFCVAHDSLSEKDFTTTIGLRLLLVCLQYSETSRFPVR